MDPTASSTTTENFHGPSTEKKRSSTSTISSTKSAARSIASVFSTNIPGDITEYELHHYPHTGRSSLQTDAATLHIAGNGGRTGATTPVYNRDSSDSGSTLTVSSAPSHEEEQPPEQQEDQGEEEGEGAEEEEEEESWLKALWGDHISVVVPIKYARDHLALERTYLSYHRTAMVFGMLSAVTAQLTVINHAPNPNPTFGFRTVGKPLSVILACCALIISIVGVLRWRRLQNGLLRGVAISGGKELMVMGGIVGMIVAGTLGVVVAIDISKEY